MVSQKNSICHTEKVYEIQISLSIKFHVYTDTPTHQYCLWPLSQGQNRLKGLLFDLSRKGAHTRGAGGQAQCRDGQQGAAESCLAWC